MKKSDTSISQQADIENRIKPEWLALSDGDLEKELAAKEDKSSNEKWKQFFGYGAAATTIVGGVAAGLAVVAVTLPFFTALPIIAIAAGTTVGMAGGLASERIGSKAAEAYVKGHYLNLDILSIKHVLAERHAVRSSAKDTAETKPSNPRSLS